MSEDLSKATPAEAPDTAPYTLEMVARITHLRTEEIVVFYRSGMVAPVAEAHESALLFDEDAILQLRRIARLLSDYRMNHAELRVMAELWQEIESLQTEVRFLREKG